MTGLLDAVLEAHGGLERWRWRGFERVEVRIVSGGGFFAMKDVVQDTEPRTMNVWLHEERSSVSPYGAPGQRSMFTPERCGGDARRRGARRASRATRFFRGASDAHP